MLTRVKWTTGPETVGRVSDRLFVFGVSRTLIILFPCQQFCFQPVWKDLPLPNRRHPSAKDKVFISRSNTDGNPFVFPPVKTDSRCALYLTSGWSDTSGTSLRSTTTTLKAAIWKTHDMASEDCVTTETRTFIHIWFDSFQSSAGSLSLHQRVIKGKIRNPQPCSLDEWAVTTGRASFITQPTNAHQHFIFTNCISNTDKVEHPRININSASLRHTE